MACNVQLLRQRRSYDMRTHLSAAPRFAALIGIAAALTACSSSSANSSTPAPPGPASTSPTTSASPSISPSASPTGTACSKLVSDLSDLPSTLASAATDPSHAQQKLNEFVDRLKQDANDAPDPVKSDVNTFVDKVQTALKNARNGDSISISGLTDQASKITNDCKPGSGTSPSASAS